MHCAGGKFVDKLNAFARRYMALWNEPDATQRRQRIAALYAEDCAHYTQNLDIQGYAALEERVSRAHQQFVTEGGFVFRPSGEPVGHHQGAMLNWIMEPAAGGAAAAAGANFIVLSEDGRIRLEYQFAAPLPAS
jgi:uncharacterized protein